MGTWRQGGQGGGCSPDLSLILSPVGPVKSSDAYLSAEELSGGAQGPEMDASTADYRPDRTRPEPKTQGEHGFRRRFKGESPKLGGLPDTELRRIHLRHLDSQVR